MQVGDVLIWSALGPDARVRVITTSQVLTYVEVLSGAPLVGQRYHLTTIAAAKMLRAVGELQADESHNSSPQPAVA